ncbi:unnamed protein product [Durusdinium trenchii]|uniref:Uncharacterized protein n=1 Tax=Durusdinium trenchii TaxID=1381693 RepID=A0ABP0SH41_9DINO
MALARMDGLIRSQEPNGAVPQPEEALQALLRGSSPYDGAGVNEYHLCWGLLYAMTEVTSGHVQALGCGLDGTLLRTTIGRERLWKVYQALKGLLARKCCSGKALEKVIGSLRIQPGKESGSLTLEPKSRPKKRQRELILEPEGRLQELKVVPKKARTMSLTDKFQKMLEEKKMPSLRLPQTDKELKEIEKMFLVPNAEKLKAGDLGYSSDSNSTSSELRGDVKGRRLRGPANRPKGALKKLVDQMSADPSKQTLLERAAVTDRVRQNYTKRLDEFRSFLEEARLPHGRAAEMDAALVIYFNKKYLAGEGAYVGDYTMAALMDADPSFGRMGNQHLPRAWRSLKGWRRLCPARSRLAFPLPVWCAISWRMCQRGHVQKAIFNLIQVCTYHRPGALLQLRKMGLVRPASGITRHWAVVTSLTETSDVSKTGTKDDSIVLDSKWITFLSPMLEQLKKGKPMDYVWSFHYGEYEKAGRLAATWGKLDSATQLTCKAAEANIEAIILGQRYPDIALP